MLRFLAGRGQVRLLVVTARGGQAPPGMPEVARAEVVDLREYDSQRPLARVVQYAHLRPCIHLPGVRRRIRAFLEQWRPQALIAVGTASAQFIDLEDKVPGTRYIFDEAGTDHLRTRRLLEAQKGRWPGLKGRWDLWRLERYERYCCSQADGLLAVVPGEAVYLRQRVASVPVTLVPCGANLELFDFRYAGDDNRTLLFCGDLTYGPNEDAVGYFLEDIFPAIAARHPEVELVVVGRYRGDRLPRLAGRFPQVELTGYVEDMNSQWRRASIFVNPLRQGRGFITKLMDAFTAGLAVVSTPFLTEELGILPGHHFLSGANAAQFAQAVCRLLEEPEKKRELVLQGRRFAEAHGWEKALQPLAQAIGAAR
jgi:glycosyltransferase involved in cell wall biosynthesis